MVVIHRTAIKWETCLTYFVHQGHGAGQHFGVSQAKEHHNAKNKGFGRRTQISDRTPLQKTRGIKPQNRRKPQGRTKLQRKNQTSGGEGCRLFVWKPPPPWSNGNGPLSSPCSMHAPPEGDHNPGDNNFGIGLDPGVHFGVKKPGFGMNKIYSIQKNSLELWKTFRWEKKEFCARSVHNRVVLGSLFNRNLTGCFVARAELQAFD